VNDSCCFPDFSPANRRNRRHLAPRISVSRSVFALIDDRDRAYFGRDGQEDDKIGFLDENTRAIFGRSYAAEPDVLVEQLKKDKAIAEADTLLLTIPNPPAPDFALHATPDQTLALKGLRGRPVILAFLLLVTSRLS